MDIVLEDLIKDPVLRRLDPDKYIYLRTDTCKQGHGNVLVQPGNDDTSLTAMNEEIAGGDCTFDISLKEDSLFPYPLGFSCHKCSEYESYLHSRMRHLS